ncbi:uncharacterized protein PV09_06171 [Verruconis gallopava]|uniref:5'-3' DNA helicase ZGRF1-like N-terminal domain-containing protein n=1 Tax=Verruconis gallopava TaxID=253628 RepID=A0A0D2AT72_9PEZI|nr:uncharacterized protein PV09_06171 [Verruconis gallopava]KIW02349.1 hypothetical protein PV09_06171 [Verruconis gallopava]
MTPKTARADVAAIRTPNVQGKALVHEFRCLYTFDVRRKQKRWQDGRAKFHTFNNRIMVYDDTQNFVGDIHWKDGSGPQPDDEFSLEVGVLVQIGDLLYTTQTDLAPLFIRERKKPESHGAEGAENAAALNMALDRKGHLSTQKHKSLHVLLNSAKTGSIKAKMSGQSPYDARKAGLDVESSDDRGRKRRRLAVNKTTHFMSKTNGTGELAQEVEKLAFKTKNNPSSTISRSTVWGRDSSPKRTCNSMANSTNIKLGVTRVECTSACYLPQNRSLMRTMILNHVESESADNHTSVSAKDSRADNAPSGAKKTLLRLGKSKKTSMLICQKLDHEGGVSIASSKQRPNLYQTLSDLEDGTREDERLKSKSEEIIPSNSNCETLVDIIDESLILTSTSGLAVKDLSTPIEDQVRFQSGYQPTACSENQGTNGGKALLANRAPINYAQKRKGTKKLSRTTARQKSHVPDYDEDRLNMVQSRDIVRPPEKHDQGPWTIEAMDLFDWRPPDWEMRLLKLST